MKVLNLFLFAILILFSYSCEKEQILTENTENATLASRSHNSFNSDCIPEQYVSSVGRSFAWQAYKQYVSDHPTELLFGLPDFKSSISLSHEVRSDGITFVPIVADDLEDNLKTVSSLFVATHNNKGSYYFLSLNANHVETNPSLAIELELLNNSQTLEFSNDDLLSIISLFGYYINCNSDLSLTEKEELLRRTCKKKSKTGCYNFGNNGTGFWQGLGNAIGGFFNALGNLGGNYSGPRITIYPPPAGGAGSIGNTTTSNGGNTDPNLIDNLNELRNCLGYDDYDDNTSPPHVNEEFCSTWMNYYESCIQEGDNFSVTDYLDALDRWAFHMTQSQYAQNGTFQNVISTTLFCVDEENFECVDILDEILEDHNTSLSLFEKNQIIQNVHCTSSTSVYENSVKEFLMNEFPCNDELQLRIDEGITLNIKQILDIRNSVDPSECQQVDAAIVANTDIDRKRLCPGSIQAERLTDDDVEAWYFKMIDFSYIFAYHDDDHSEIFNVGFGDLCVQVSNNSIVSPDAANIAYAAAFEHAVTQTKQWLNDYTWDDILMNTGAGITVYGLISDLFKGYLQENLATAFGGTVTVNAAECNGVQGSVPFFDYGC